MLPTALSLFIAASPIVQVEEATPRVLYERAIDVFNEGRIKDAHAMLAKIVQDHPRAFFAYGGLWEATGKLFDEAGLRRTLERDLAFLVTVEEAERTEPFYRAIIDCHRSLGNDHQVEPWRRELIRRLPRSLAARRAMLREAENTEDPREACRLYTKFIDAFPDDVRSAMVAARGRFDRMVVAGELFEVKELVAAARSLESFGPKFAKAYGRHTNALVTGIHIAGSLMERAPDESLLLAYRMHDWVLETAPKTQEFEATAVGAFLPFRVAIHQRQGAHEEAIKAGGALFPENDVIRPFRPQFGVRLNEADLRHAYGLSLSSTGQHSRACEQLAYAAHLNEAFQGALDAGRKRALAAGTTLVESSELVAKFDSGRLEYRKAKVLGGEIQEPAAPFSLKSLTGDQVALSDFKGKVVILNFWATW